LLDELAAERAKLLEKTSAELETQASQLEAEIVFATGGASSGISQRFSFEEQAPLPVTGAAGYPCAQAVVECHNKSQCC